MLVGSDTILEVENLCKLYSRKVASTRRRTAKSFFDILFRRQLRKPQNLRSGEFWSLDNISFSLKRGEALGVIGLNGAGKTTLLRILAGQILPDGGEVRTLGNTAAMIDLTAGFDASASGRNNIYLRGAMLGRSRELMESKFQEIIDFSELGDAIDAPFGTYSSGMKMRLAFSVMIVSEPDILFIDEILSVGDFKFQQKCLAKIREIRERTAFVLVSHSMSHIKLFCTKVAVLNKGQIAFLGAPEEAIEVYENLQFPTVESKAEKQAAILNPQFHNAETITELEHFWCSANGKPIDTAKTGESLYFKLKFKLNYAPKNLILGIPVWTESGVQVTGFTTPREGKGLDVKANQTVELMLNVPNLAFNAGNYVSNIAIHDGLEFLYRGMNPPLNVDKGKKETWGIVNLPHKWEIM